MGGSRKCKSGKEKNANEKVHRLATDVGLSPARAPLKISRTHLTTDPPKDRRLGL